MLNHLLLLTCCKYSRFESYLFNLKGEIYDELFIAFLGCTLSFMFLSIKWYVITMITVMTCSYTPPHPLLGANTEKKTYLEQNKG